MTAPYLPYHAARAAGRRRARASGAHAEPRRRHPGRRTAEDALKKLRTALNPTLRVKGVDSKRLRQSRWDVRGGCWRALKNQQKE